MIKWRFRISLFLKKYFRVWQSCQSWISAVFGDCLIGSAEELSFGAGIFLSVWNCCSDLIRS